MSSSFSKLGSIHFHYKQPNTIRTQTDAHCNGSLHIPLVILCNIHAICGQTHAQQRHETDSSTLAQHTTLCTVHRTHSAFDSNEQTTIHRHNDTAHTFTLDDNNSNNNNESSERARGTSKSSHMKFQHLLSDLPISD